VTRVIAARCGGTHDPSDAARRRKEHVMKKALARRVRVDTAVSEETVLAAAERMRQRNVGTLVVVDRERRAVGIVTDRDIVVRVVAARRDPAATRVGDVMTRDPTIVTEHGAPDIALLLMKEGGFRRLPVVDADRRVVGILSIDDVLRSLVSDLVGVAGVLDVQSPEMVATA
jgi:CBS domain-containing protein